MALTNRPPALRHIHVNYDKLYFVSTNLIWITFLLSNVPMPVPVATRSKAYVCGRSPAEIVGSNPTGGMDVCLV